VRTGRSIKEAEYTDQLLALPRSCLGYCGWWYVCDTAWSLQDLSEFPWIQIYLTVSPFLTTYEKLCKGDDVFQLAANLAEEIMKTHAFQEGNKQIA
jgi:hypothetical protein